MKFWNRVSTLMNQLPSTDRTFIENAWGSFPRIMGQLWFNIQNAISSISPDHIPIYAIQYWKKYENPWSVSALVSSIPTMQDTIFASSPITYTEGTDYSISNNMIVWTVIGPTDGDMELSGVANWTQIGSPTTFAKNTTDEYAGTRCLEVAGVSGDGAKSDAVTVAAEDWIRYTVYAKCDVNYKIELWDESNNAKIADLTGLSGSVYAQHEILDKTPVGCTSVTMRAYLSGSGTLYLDDLELTRYPENEFAFAEQTMRYNPYLDTKLGYDLRFSGINTSSYGPIHAHHIIRALNFSYRSSDSQEHAMAVGLTAALGLPFAYVAGTIKSKSTAGSTHSIVITDSAGVDHTIEVDSSLASLSDFPAVDATVDEFEPLISDALKFKELGNKGFVPTIDESYPTDGDMELYVDTPTNAPTVGEVTGGSFFTGVNATDNKGFDAGIGDWVQGAGGVLASTVGGQTANGGEYTVGASPSTALPSLSTGLEPLIIGKTYYIEYYLKYDTAWAGGDVTLTIDGQTVVHTPTTSFVKKTLSFTAVGTDPAISLTCASTPTSGDILWIDTFELSLATRTYYVKYTYTDAGGETLESLQSTQAVQANYLLDVTSPSAQTNATGWDVYVSEISGSENKQNGTSIAIATDWTEPVSGLISGSALPTVNDTGLNNWSAINGAVIIKNGVEEYEGSRCLKITTDAIDEGVKPAANQAVTAGEEYVFDFYIKRDSGGAAIIRADVIDVTQAATIKSEWFGDSTYENGNIRFTVPTGCSSVRIEFIAINVGISYVDSLAFFNIEEISSYATDKTSDSIKASYTIAAAGRTGTEDLIFQAADHIYGVNGNYVDIVVVASGANQALSSTISGSGTSASHYVYTVTTGNNDATQNSNSAIRDFVNADPNAIGIIICQSVDDSTADPAYALTQTPLAGGVNATISTYSTVPMVVDDIIEIRNLTLGTKEIRKVTAITAGSAPYNNVISIDADLYASYTSPETGISTSVGVNFLTDPSKTWAADEHKNYLLIDSADVSFKITTNDVDTLTVVGTPTAGAYRIVKDHVAINYGHKDVEYTNEIKVYNRFVTTFLQANIDALVENAPDLGHKFTFVDVST